MARRPKLARLEMELAEASRRSRFALWLSKPTNLAELRQRLRKHGSNWTVVAEWANAEGLTGARGHPMTSVAAKRAYERAGKLARAPQPSPTHATPSPRQAIQSLPEPSASASADSIRPVEPEEPRTPPKLVLRPAKSRTPDDAPDPDEPGGIGRLPRRIR